MKRTLILSLMMLSQMAVALPSNADSAKPEKNEVLSKIVGTVSFEQRTGIMPMTMISSSYWSVVVHANGMDYVLSQVFGMDRDVQPSSAKIQGTVVHPGEQVVIEGMVQKVRKGFGLLSEIGKIKVARNENSDLND